MATTPNYGWVTAAPTDFVTDLPADFEIFADAVDASFAADEGDLLVGGTSNIFEALPIGAAGTVLTSDGDTAAWVAPAGGGKVLQVVQATTSTETTSASGTYADVTNLTASITPSSTNSKVLAFVAVNGIRVAGGIGASFRLVRTSTEINVFGNQAGRAFSQAFDFNPATVSTTYLDSPATTSATTYKVQISATGSFAQVNRDNVTTSTIVLMEIGA
jgi:hypothetical protein